MSWPLTGRRNLTGKHITNVTNASRTMLMNVKTLDWDDDILKEVRIPRTMLPETKSSSEIYGHVGAGSPRPKLVVEFWMDYNELRTNWAKDKE